MWARTDPAVESGKGRGRGSREGLTRTSCSLPPEQMEGLNTSTPFLSSMAPLSIFIINQDSMKGNHKFLFLALRTLFLPKAAVWWVMEWVTVQGTSCDSNPAVSQLWPKSIPRLSLLILDQEMARPFLSVARDKRYGSVLGGAAVGTAGRLPWYGIQWPRPCRTK